MPLAYGRRALQRSQAAPLLSHQLRLDAEGAREFVHGGRRFERGELPFGRGEARLKFGAFGGEEAGALIEEPAQVVGVTLPEALVERAGGLRVARGTSRCQHRVRMKEMAEFRILECFPLPVAVGQDVEEGGERGHGEVDPAVLEIQRGGFLLSFDEVLDAVDEVVDALLLGAQLFAGEDGAGVGEDASEEAA